MCVQDKEQVSEGMENLGDISSGNDDEDCKTWPLHSEVELSAAQNENWGKSTSSDHASLRNSFPLETISEDTAVADRKQTSLNNFLPALRSGEWCDIGSRSDMEDTHICIEDLAKNFGYNLIGEEAISFYGVFDGHGGKGAAQFVRDKLPRVIVEDADFPLEIEKVVTRSFMKTDAAFADSCSLRSALSSGTTALAAMIFGRWLLNL